MKRSLYLRKSERLLEDDGGRNERVDKIRCQLLTCHISCYSISVKHEEKRPGAD